MPAAQVVLHAFLSVMPAQMQQLARSVPVSTINNLETLRSIVSVCTDTIVMVPVLLWDV